MSDDARLRILERRAAFVAAAIASLATVGCDNKPQACLSAVPDEKAKVLPSSDASVATEEDAEAHPQPCLSEVPMPCLSPPVPTPCLSVAAPKDVGVPGDAGKPHPCLKMAMPRDGGEW